MNQFKDFLMVDDAKTKGTAEDYCRWMRRFFSRVDSVSVEDIRSYLKDLKEDWSVHYYCSNLSALKAYFDRFKGYPQLVAGFKFPRKPLKLKQIPSKEYVQRFYEALPSLRTEAYFLVTASSGLRRGEVLSLEVERNVDFDKRMLTPSNHMGSTKHSWVSFYNEEAEIVLMEFRGKLTKRQKHSPKLFPFRLMTFKRDWKVARQKTGLHITPKVLRDWFSEEMGNLNVPDRYIDAFCGRTPKSVLARHYSDYSPEKLKRIYDRANLKVLA